MHTPLSEGPATPVQQIQSQHRLWNDRSSAAVALNIPNALLISASGKLKYQHFVEICFYTAKKWRPMQEHLVLDFSKLRFAEASGIRYIANQLHAMATQSGGHVYFVRIPPAAKAFLDRTWGSENIHFVQSLKSIVYRVPAPRPAAGPSTAIRPLRRRRGRKPQKTSLQERARIANQQRPIVK